MNNKDNYVILMLNKTILNNNKINLLIRCFITRNYNPRAKNHYQVLEVPFSASLEQVKRKYYQKAKLFHPDVSKDSESNSKFVLITKAYQILSDPKLKSQYDREIQQHSWSSAYRKKENTKKPSPFQKQTGSKQYSKKQKTAANQQDFQPFSNFDQYFGRNRHHQKSKKGQDIHINVTVTLQQSVQGVKKSILYNRKCYCSQCATKVYQSCFSCGGKGQIYNRKNRQKQKCQKCQGVGYKNNCNSCGGDGHYFRDIQQSIHIEANTHNRSILKFHGKGHQGLRHDNGDLYFTVLVQENEELKTDGNNVYSEVHVDYIKAIFGGEVEVKTVRGNQKISIQSGTQSGKTVRLFNQGLISQYSKRRGDHIVQFKIKIPEKMTQKQFSLLKQLQNA